MTIKKGKKTMEMRKAAKILVMGNMEKAGLYRQRLLREKRANHQAESLRKGEGPGFRHI